MKKLKGILLGGLLLAFLFTTAYPGTIVVAKKEGAWEFFGAAKNIDIVGIGFHLGLQYVKNDDLKFTLPTGFSFQNAAGNYFLVVRTASGGYTNDADNNGTPEFTHFTGGNGDVWVTFRVDDDANAFTNPCNTWYICSVNNPADPTVASMKIQVPANPAVGDYAITTESKRATDGTVFDADTTPPDFFEILNEFGTSKAPAGGRTDTIDVEQQRRNFLPAASGKVHSSLDNLDITQTAGLEYATGQMLTGGTTYWRFVVGGAAGNMQGVQEVEVQKDGNGALTTFHPVGDSTTVDVTANNMGTAYPANNSVRIQVDGVSQLAQRTVDLTVDFLGDAIQNFRSRQIHNQNNTWTWTTNGTVFRAAFFTTATASGNYSAFRIVNNAAQAAEVYADVYMDGGTNSVASGTKIADIAATSKVSFTAWQMCSTLGIAGLSNVAGTGEWKGWCVITVWAPRLSTFGSLLHLNGFGYTTIELGKEQADGSYRK
jgi:hypothetical protein